jgi:hypothetical protein
MADRNNLFPHVRVPVGPERILSGIVKRDGRFYWSGWTMFWRLALTMFVIKFAIQLMFALPPSRAEPELLGIPGMSMPVAGESAITTTIVAALWVLIAGGQRRRFNAAAPPVPKPTQAPRERDDIK